MNPSVMVYLSLVIILVWFSLVGFRICYLLLIFILYGRGESCILYLELIILTYNVMAHMVVVVPLWLLCLGFDLVYADYHKTKGLFMDFLFYLLPYMGCSLGLSKTKKQSK
jgi:hypothetical protein